MKKNELPPESKELSPEQKEAVLAAHSSVNALAAELEQNQPGPFALVAYAQKLKAAVAPLLPLLSTGSESLTPTESLEGETK